jgi:hypothetical protein
MSNIELLSLYRDILCDKLDILNTEALCEPVLQSFLQIIDSPDVLEAFKAVWHFKKTSWKSSQKNDIIYQKQQFMKCVLQIWPLSHIADIPSIHQGISEQQEWVTILNSFLLTNYLESF